MKKIISTILVSLFAVSSVLAAPAKKTGTKTTTPMTKPVAPAPVHENRTGSFSRPYGLAGCGLGSIALGKQDNQIFASTLNYTGGQSFAITSGTSNCVESPTSAKADRMDKYIMANQVALADDIARGQGETIQGLAQIMNCQQAENLGPMLQSKFSSIFTSQNLKANEITDRIITIVGQDNRLATACGVTVSAL